MNELEIVINPYNCTTSLKINDRAISPYSELANYLKEPFYTWCDKVLNIISNELNDEFKITIVSREAEAFILFGLAKNYEDCVKVEHKNFYIDMPIIDRLKRLYEISNQEKINIEAKDILVNLFIANNSKESFINEYFDKNADGDIFDYEDYPLCNVKLNIKEYSEIKFKEAVQNINFIITYNIKEAEAIYDDIKKYNSEIFILVNDNNFKVQKKDNAFICECDKQRLLNILFELLEFRYITPFYITALRRVREKINNDNIKLLGSVEPFVSVSCESQLEVNTFVPLVIKSYPDNMDIPKLDFKFSKEKIISCDGKNILGLSAGEVDVEIYVQGNLMPVSKFHVTVVQRNKIKRIELNKENFIMGVQDVIKLSCKFWPENADNTSELRWTSTDDTVAVVDKVGNITALKQGTCYIEISTEDISASCLISVKPKITNIKLSKQDINIYMGETTGLDVEIYPVDVINSNIFWKTSDKDVAIFQNGIIKATGIGKANITFYTQDKSVINSCEVKVASTFEKKEYKNTTLSASVILFILSIVLSGIRGVNLIMPILGAILGFLAIKCNEKDKGMATVFIVLNAVIFLVVFFNLFRL